MTDRFNPFPLVASALGSLKSRAIVGREPRDWLALAVLVLLPLVVGGVSLRLEWVIRDSNALIAGFSLMAAALLGTVPQFAAWRQRLSERGLQTERVAARKLDEAVYNTLVAALVSVMLAGVSVVLGNISVSPRSELDNGEVLPWVARWLTVALSAGGAYLVLTLILIVNLMFDAYQDANGVTRKDADGSERWIDSGGDA